MKKYWNHRVSFWLRIIVLFCGILVNVSIINNYRNVSSDFVQDYIASYSLRSGEALYGENITKLSKEILGFSGIKNFHPPFNALLFLPFSFINYQTAYVALGLISINLLLLINQLIVKGFELNGEWFLNFACFTLYWWPVFNCIGAGQSSMIIAACLVGGWFSLRYKKDYVAGFLFAIATLMKLFPGLVLLYLLIMKNLRAFFAAISFIIIGLIVTTIIVGIDDIRTYIMIIVAEDVDVFQGLVFNHSIGGIVAKLFGKQMGWFSPLVKVPHIASLLIILLSIGVLIYTILKLREMAAEKELSDYSFGLTLVTMLLLSPIAWSHIFPVLILPIGLLLREYIDEPSSKRLRLLLFVLLCLSLPDILIARALVSIHYPHNMPLYGRMLTLGPGIGMILLWLVLTRRARIDTSTKNIRPT